jgi:hypothetical protein
MFDDNRDNCDKCGCWGHYSDREYYNGKPLCTECAESEGLLDVLYPYDIDLHDYYPEWGVK